MSLNKSLMGIVFLVLLASSVACALTGEGPAKPDTPPELDSQDAIATGVAATLAAGQGDDPTATIQPAATADSLPPVEQNFSASGVQLYLSEQLAENITAVIVPANLNGDNSFWNTPEHREYQFTNWALKEDAFHQPVIRIYSIAEFEAVNPNMGGSLSALQAALAAQPADGAGLMVPDQFNAGQLFQSNIRYLDFQNGNGARWLSQYGQAYFPVGLPFLFYTFQGFTADGAYFISAILPVTHPVLPPADSVVMDDAFYNDYENYASETRILLNSQADASFLPSLELLDQMVESLTVSEP